MGKAITIGCGGGKQSSSPATLGSARACPSAVGQREKTPTWFSREYTRRFLRHPRFETAAKRMGIVARVHHNGINFWARNRAALSRILWPET
jgi:hypothetical protein